MRGGNAGKWISPVIKVIHHGFYTAIRGRDCERYIKITLGIVRV